MSFLEINPDFRDLFRQAGLTHARDFLLHAGEAISVRPERQVRRIILDRNQVAYLKTETRILVRERLGSLWGGFGWESKSVREGKVLRELAQAGIGCPTVMALGEADGQAFVLLQAEPNLAPLHVFLRREPAEARRIAKLLALELTRMHDAGFYHPDLFAKHVLVGRQDGLYRICILDWQRTRRLHKVSWSRRLLDLAALDASLVEGDVGERDRVRFLRYYLAALAEPSLPWPRLVTALRGRTWILLRQRRIRRQRLAARELGTPALSPSNRHDWRDCPLRLTDPNLATLPLVNFLRPRTDVSLDRLRNVLRCAGQTLQHLHHAGFGLVENDLSSWAVLEVEKNAPEIVSRSAADLRATSGLSENDRAEELARLLIRHGLGLSATDRLRVLIGYLGQDASRLARHDLVRRILDARELAS